MASKSAPRKPQRARRAKKSSARRVLGRIAIGALADFLLGSGIAGDRPREEDDRPGSTP